MKANLKFIALITAILYILMLFPGALIYAGTEDVGYKDGYDNGWMDGAEAAKIDFAQKLYKSYYRSMPNTTQITETYKLNETPSKYRYDFISGYITGYREGYNKAYDNPSMDESSGDYGASLGESMGGINGFMDYYAGRSNVWNNSIPSTERIIELFDLMKEPADYRNSFISSFKDSYKASYETGYRDAKYKPYENSLSRGESDGANFGGILGANNGKKDYYMGRASDYKRNLLTDERIKVIFVLNNDSKEYMDAFISSFKTAYREQYEEAYRTANAEFQEGWFQDLTSTLESQLIPIAGGQIISGDNKMGLKIDKGIYYNEVIVSVDKNATANASIKMPASSRFTKASELYSIRVANPTVNLNRDKMLMLSFEYYGPYGGGIYKYTSSGWKYIPSKIEANSISAVINPASLNNKSITYAVFIDSNAWTPDDIRGNWAKDEILAYLRNGIAGVYSDNTFRPDISINRAQLLTYMSRVYKWNLKSAGSSDIAKVEKLADYKEFEYYKELAAYCIKYGYLKVNANNTLKLNSPVTYKEVESMMKIATYNKNFSWMTIADKIMRNKDKRSKSYNSMDNYVTRAEAVYMLYYLTE